MNAKHFWLNPGRAAAAVAVAGTLAVGGATWRGFAAEPETTAQLPVMAEAAQRVAPAIAGARDSYADTVKAVSPSVVTINVQSRARVSPTGMQDDDLLRRFFGERTPQPMPMPRREGVGSGVIVSNDGYILTNHHVVDGASEVRVTLTDGREFVAQSIGSDQPSDLALLKIDATNLRPLALGDSDAVEVGDVVLAIGNPLNIGQTVTMGIVSAKGRQSGFGNGGYEDFLQTDAPINQGNSGGALVSTRGELIGINSQILSPSGGNIGIGFAIPSNMARHVMEELRAEGRVRRAQLGITIQPVTADIASSLGLSQVRGAIVSAVDPNSAASRAGIERGDVITTYNGQGVTDNNSLRNRVASTRPGSTVTLVVMRDGRERTLTATLEEADATRQARNSNRPDAPVDSAGLGVSVAPLTPELRSRAGVANDVNGLLVQQVTPDSRAAAAGIRAGDVILEVNRMPVRSADELRNAVRSSSNRPVLLLVNREGRDLFVAVRP